MTRELALSEDLADLSDGQSLLLEELIGKPKWERVYFWMRWRCFLTICRVRSVQKDIRSMISLSIDEPVS